MVSYSRATLLYYLAVHNVLCLQRVILVLLHCRLLSVTTILASYLMSAYH